MPKLEVTLNLDEDPWVYGHNRHPFAPIDRVGLHPHGMSTGRPALLISVRLSEHQAVIGWIPWRLWQWAMGKLAEGPVAQIDRLEEMGVEALMSDLELSDHSKKEIAAYQAKLRAEGMRMFADYLDEHPLPVPVRSSIYAQLARERAERLEEETSG